MPGDDQFTTFANEALIELEERYGVTTLIAARVRELTNRYYRGLEIIQALDEPMTIDKLAAELEVDTDEVHDRITYLSTFGRVQRYGAQSVPWSSPVATMGREGGRLVGEHDPA